jgi:hypothetical protein
MPAEIASTFSHQVGKIPQSGGVLGVPAASRIVPRAARSPSHSITPPTVLTIELGLPRAAAARANTTEQVYNSACAVRSLGVPGIAAVGEGRAPDGTDLEKNMTEGTRILALGRHRQAFVRGIRGFLGRITQ